ncbi:MAG: M28 family peptidase [Planctomycetales bacterium]|nr:M28 family peptidase [Planctomycetales bacterium]
MLEHSPQVRPTRAVPTTRAQDQAYVESLISRIVEKCPTRAPTSEQEREAQLMLQAELNTRGVRTHLLPFRFSSNLYAVLALHFAVAVAGSAALLFSPLTALVLHLLAGVSYLAEASHWGYLLRRVFPWRRSQNLIGKLPARGKPRLRIVMLGHADAAHTGVMFNPLMVGSTSSKDHPQPFGFTRKHMLFAVLGMFAMALVDVMMMTTGYSMPMLYWGLTAGSLVGLLLNVQVVWRNQIVPGASDNLSGCAALPVLASRFADKKPDDVEMVFVATGCEESGVGGSAALAHQMRSKWDRHDTIVIGLDILTNGKLCYKTVNEVIPFTLPLWLIDILQTVAERHPTIGRLGIYDACAGTDDAVPFVVKGYDGVCIACSDPRLGVSREYHLMTDTPENVDYEKLMNSIDFVEEVVDEVIRRKLEPDVALDPRRVVSHEGEGLTGAFALFTRPWVWPLVGVAAGAYYAAIMHLDWEVAHSAFRGALSALIMWFPLAIVLDWFNWRPDERRSVNWMVFTLLSTIGVAGVGLLAPTVLAALLPGSETAPTTTLAAWGAAAGALVGVVFGLVLSRRTIAARAT